jgi:hypothetical protein
MKADTHPFAINILKLQRYNFNFFSTEEVVFFEYVVIKGRSFICRAEFFHSSETIRRETGIKKHALNSIIKRFVNLGILGIKVKGMPRVKYFTLNYQRIIELLPQIYLLNESKAQGIDQQKLLLDFMQPIAEENVARQKKRRTFSKIERVREMGYEKVREQVHEKV